MSTHNICFHGEIRKNIISPRKVCCEYPQYMFSLRNKKNTNTFGLERASYEEL